MDPKIAAPVRNCDDDDEGKNIIKEKKWDSMAQSKAVRA